MISNPVTYPSENISIPASIDSRYYQLAVLSVSVRYSAIMTCVDVGM